MGIIYCIKNKTNGKIYVGKTTQTLEDRWKEHIAFANRGRKIYFSNAIRKYGPDAFEPSVLEETEDHLLSDAEIKWIAELKSADHKIGYNSTHGGEGFSTGDLNPNRLNPRRGSDNPSFGVPKTAEQRQKISQSLMGLLVGEKNPFFGRKHTEYTRKHIGDIQRGQKRGPHSESTKEKIRQRMLNRVFAESTLEKMRGAKLGKPLSEDHKAKLRAAQAKRREREAQLSSQPELVAA